MTKFHLFSPCLTSYLLKGTVIDKESRAIAKAGVAAAVAANNNVIRAHAKVALLLGSASPHTTVYAVTLL
jgi:hypothetical protein